MCSYYYNFDAVITTHINNTVRPLLVSFEYSCTHYDNNYRPRHISFRETCPHARFKNFLNAAHTPPNRNDVCAAEVLVACQRSGRKTCGRASVALGPCSLGEPRARSTPPGPRRSSRFFHSFFSPSILLAVSLYPFGRFTNDTATQLLLDTHHILSLILL